MRAATHTEVYRPFEGALRRHPLRWLTLAWSGVRVGFRRKLPALLLYAMPVILTIITSFIVQIKFEAEAGTIGGVIMGDERQARAIGMMLSNQLGEVEGLIIQLMQQMQFFVVLAMGWYGSGLIAEDRRQRAHLLYFARPLTRSTYLFGKLGTVAFWGWCAVGLPVMIVCSVACFSSPDWAFLTERWDAIVLMLLHAALWVLVHALLVLAISSLCARRNHALVGLFGFYILTSAGAEAMTQLFADQAWRLLSIPRNLERIAAALFDQSTYEVTWPVEASVWALGFLMLACVFVLTSRTRKLEVGT